MSDHDTAQKAEMTAARSFAVAAAAIVAASVALPGTATATPPRDVDGTVIWQMTDDGKDYVFREITRTVAAPVWHSHDGQLFGVVKDGTLMHNRSDCSMDGLYVAGQSIAEKGGLDYVHIGRNVGPAPLVLQILYIDPAGVRCPTTRPIRVAGLPDAGNGHPPGCWLRILMRSVDERRCCAG